MDLTEDARASLRVLSLKLETAGFPAVEGNIAASTMWQITRVPRSAALRAMKIKTRIFLLVT